MQRKKLTSSSIAEVGYDRDSKVLEILFTSGGLYSYEGVPEDVFRVLATTDSPGVFFASNIRGNPHYPATCLRPRRDAEEKTHGEVKQKGKSDSAKESVPKKTRKAQV